MKTLGIIGGMSYESSTHYYERINKQVNDRLGGLNTARIIMYSVNFEELEPLMRTNKWDEIAITLTDIAKKLELVGADVIIIATNTMHKLFDQIQSNINVPMIHIADTVAQRCNEQGITEVGLLGTAYTMRESFLKDRLKQNGLSVVVPEDKTIDEINRIIFEELCVGTVNDKSRAYYKNVIEGLHAKHGIKGVILGCTEIEMLVKDQYAGIPLFDTAQAHIDGIVDYVAPKKLVASKALNSDNGGRTL